ncbi:MAG: SulP family inorganic anion transporter [Gemmatimonadaceae bacterium]
MLVPKLFTTLQTYDRSQLVADLTAGVIVGVVALPLAIAFAIASGVGPSRGLYTAIVAGFIISALGGSRVQIGGPTGAFVVIVYGIVQKFGIDGLIVATMMAGVILVILGVTRLGSVIKFIPHPVIIGFTSGIAVIIFSGEIRDLAGLRMGNVPADFIPKIAALAEHLGAFNPYAIGLSALTLGIILVWPAVSRRVPGMFVALIVVTVVARWLHLPVETIGSRFGAINAALPHPIMPHLSFEQVRGLVAPAFTIAMLGAIESLLSAVVSDGMIGSRHRSNMELVAQGIANIVTPLFGGIPATGAIARTATNVKNGGRTPVAGMTHAVTLLLITLFFGRWAGLVPMAALGGILTIVAYNMSEWRSFVAELRAPRSDVAVLLATFLLTVFVDLTVAIGVGIVASCLLFMRRMAEVTNVSAMRAGLNDGDAEADPYGTEINGLEQQSVPPDVEVFEINGPFFFGAVETFRETLGHVGRTPRALIIRLRDVPAIDSTGIHALAELLRRCRKDGTRLLLTELGAQPLAAIARSGLLGEIGSTNVCDTIASALNQTRARAGV